MAPPKVAPKGKLRVIGQDDPSDPGWKRGDFDTPKEAEEAAPAHAFIRFRIFDDQGKAVNEPPRW